MTALLETRDVRLAYLAPWIRWIAAIVFVVFGATKFVSHASEVTSFRQYGLPSPDAFVYAIGVVEIIGGAMIAAGVLTRLAALVLVGDMVGAIVVSGIHKGEVVPSLTLAPLLLVAMGFLVVVGPGPRSVDARLAGSGPGG